MNNVFVLALMAAPIAASAAWSIGSLDIGTKLPREGSTANGNVVTLSGVMLDGTTPASKYTVVCRGIVSANETDTYERTCTYDYVRTGAVAQVVMDTGYMNSWRVGIGATYADAKANIIASAVRLNGEWLVNGTRSKPVMGIDHDRRVTVEFDPDGGSVIEVLGSEDLRTWTPATAKSRFFKAVQKEALK